MPLTTNLGGVLYLLNLFAHLDLPRAFQSDWHLADHLGPWDLLEAVGRALLDPLEDDTWQDDPLWALLADLGGRAADEPPGADLPLIDFRLPRAWVQTVGTIRGRAVGGRLTLWTDDPFVLVDCAHPANAETEAARYGARAVLWAPAGAQPQANWRADWLKQCAPSLRRWLTHVLPYLRIWLQRALALPDSDPKRLTETLLRCRAQIHVTRTHVDLFLSLEQIALPVRLSGLDRSPGWLPHAGRVVTFHFD